MEESTRKKKTGIVLLVLALVLPLFMASNWGLGILESIALDNTDKEWAASLDLGVADFYGISLRPESQREVYERFLQNFTTHPKRGYAKYSIAVCVEKDIETGKHHAREAYEAFIAEYADDPNSKEYLEEAEKALVRLRNN